MMHSHQKRYKVHITRAVWLYAVLLSLVQGCRDDDICVENPIPNMRVGFKKYIPNDEGVHQDTILNLFSIKGIGTDSVLRNEQTSDNLLLPLRIESTQTSYAMEVGRIDTIQRRPVVLLDTLYLTDTLEISYRTDEEFVSKACGFRFIFKEMGVTPTRTLIDSLQVLNSEITNDVETHIILYY